MFKNKDVKIRLGIIALAFALGGSSLTAEETRQVVCENGKCVATIVSSNNTQNKNENTKKFKTASVTQIINKDIISLDDNEENYQEAEIITENEKELNSKDTIIVQTEDINTEYSTEYQNYEEDFSTIKKSAEKLNIEGDIYAACEDNTLLVCDTVDKTCKCV